MTTATVTPTSATVSCPAIMGEQSGFRIFVGLMAAKDLTSISTVHHFNSSLPIDHPKQGYQRPEERTRITKIGRFLIDEIVNKLGQTGGLFPTAVVLAARTPLKFQNGKLTISGQQLQLIDGQHRVAGERYAIDEKGVTELGDFQMPFVIVEVADRTVEMTQFRVINGTAKSVRTDLVNAILTATVAKQGDDAIPEKEHWKVVVTKTVDKLDKESTSPWRNLITMPDEAGSPKGTTGKIVRATSFMTSLRPVYARLGAIGRLDSCHDLEEQADVLFSVVSQFWLAVREVVPGAFAAPDDHVIQKTPGLFSLHKLLAYLLPVMFKGRQEWTKDNFVKFIQDSPELTDAHYWESAASGAAAYGSMKGFEDLYELLRDSIEPKL